ncbi:MAG: asparaginase [Candidatus Eisenbacteria bacterium]|uniref:Asparaginase n=1 Tax=Eiseniibacteriota bacterium TaxID=2212470 RepID=A0A9D6L7R3_UNCEI|nr:asparaginase [Candidatus Eisenbacteria bacterium]MBI3540478.1 asparaginase [Candidatus Eisenbacteria bacterium]
MRLQIDVVVWRGSIPESRHRVQAAVCAAAGRLEAATDQPELLTTFRSAAKPFQLLPLVERGHADRWRFGDEELAVMAASHTGSPAHVALVRGILERIGLSERHLACGYHDPIDPESLAIVRSRPDERSPVYNNCSGKHAGMLCLALSEGWPVEGYGRADHPVQLLMRGTVGEACGIDPDALAVAVDGCSVSVFGLPLSGMARAYARLAAAREDGDARERALARIRGAMCRHPRAVGGEGRFSTVLMERTGGRIVAKGGAEGLECAGIPERGLGLALKAEDGAARGVGPATLALLELLGDLTEAEIAALRESRRPIVHNHAGLEVGSLEAVVKVLTPAM